MPGLSEEECEEQYEEEHNKFVKISHERDRTSSAENTAEDLCIPRVTVLKSVIS